MLNLIIIILSALLSLIIVDKKFEKVEIVRKHKYSMSEFDLKLAVFIMYFFAIAFWGTFIAEHLRIIFV